MCYISLSTHTQSLLTFKIFIIKIKKIDHDIFLVLNATSITLYHIKAIQDDISAKTVPVWLHHTVDKIVTGKILFDERRLLAGVGRGEDEVNRGQLIINNTCDDNGNSWKMDFFREAITSELIISS